MDKESEIKRIDNFLLDYDKEFNRLTKNQKEKMLLIDKAIQARKTNIKKARETIKNNAINPSTISKDTGIKREAFYQCEMFAEYIKSYKTFEQRELLEQEIQKRDSEIEKLNSFIKQFLERDMEYAEKIIYLENELKWLKDSINY